jgi:metal-responsive CopG/Arc/MetJ family transcriptional regulator
VSKTSTEAKRKFNQKTYTRVLADLPKEMVAKFKEKVKANGTTVAEVIRAMIQEYLKEPDERNKPD